VVTSSVAIAGVLLVFSYLVIPAVIAALFCDGVRTRLFAGWGIGVAVSVAGLVLSYEQDLPSGPTVVVSFGAALSLAGVAHYVLGAERRGSAVLHVLGGAVGLVVLLGGSLLLQKDEHAGYRDQLSSPHSALRHAALGRAMGEPALWAIAAQRGPELFADEEAELRELAVSLVLEHDWREFLPEVRALLQDQDDLVREAAVRCLLMMNDTEAVGALIVAARSEADEFLAVEMADSLCELGQPIGLELLIELMDTAELEFARHDAWEHVRAHTELELPFDDALAADDAANDAMVARFAEWFAANGATLVWEPESGHFH